MISFHFKRIGYFVVVLSFICFLLIMLNFSSPATDVWIEAFKWIGLCGLVLVTVSREKDESPEIERRRLRCFFRTFFMGLLFVIVFSLSNLVFTNDKVSLEKAFGYLGDYDVLKFSILFLAVHLSSLRNEIRKIGNMP